MLAEHSTKVRGYLILDLVILPDSLLHRIENVFGCVRPTGGGCGGVDNARATVTERETDSLRFIVAHKAFPASQVQMHPSQHIDRELVSEEAQ